MSLSMNPIRRVVTMLESMQSKVAEEAKKSEEIHKKFTCFCRSNEIEKEISDAEAKSAQLEGSIKENGERLQQLGMALEKLRKDRATSQATVKQAGVVREKESKELEEEVKEKQANIEALGRAIASLQRGTIGFLQASAAKLVQQLSVDMDLTVEQRDSLTEFFSQKSDENDSPQSGEIIGILATMKSDMEKDLVEVKTAQEEGAKSHEAEIGAKKQEIDALSEELNEKQLQMGESNVELQEMTEDLINTRASLEADRNFIKNKDIDCARAEADYQKVKESRGEELVAISKTIKMLNDDDALQLFKKTLPSAFLLQLQVTGKQVRRRALQVLRRVKHHHNAHLDLIELALHGKKVSFNKIITMIDDMLQLLDNQQRDDDMKQQMCHDELDKAEDDLKSTEAKIKRIEKNLRVHRSTIEQATEDISDLEAGIAKLDKEVTEATQTRKEEHQQYDVALAEIKAAKELLLGAKNQLNQFYNPKLYKEPPQEELSREEAIAAKFASPALVQVSAYLASTARQPPTMVNVYQSQGNQSAGVIEMINGIVSDLDVEVQEQKVEEDAAQKDYETFIEDSKKKRTMDAKTIQSKQHTKAAMEVQMRNARTMDKAKEKELFANQNVLADLRQDCDWLLMNYDARKQARIEERDSLKQAKGVLSGMDLSLVQISRSH